jgi:hypothetical protein
MESFWKGTVTPDFKILYQHLVEGQNPTTVLSSRSNNVKYFTVAFFYANAHLVRNMVIF